MDFTADISKYIDGWVELVKKHPIWCDVEVTADITKYIDAGVELAKKNPIQCSLACVLVFVIVLLPVIGSHWVDFLRKLKAHIRWIVAGCIVLVLVFFFGFWALFTMLGNKQIDSESAITDSSRSHTEAIEETSSELTEGEIRYVVVQADVTWSEAEKACEDDGGHLATITSQEEYEQVVDVLDSYIQENGSSAEDIFYVWLGGCTETLDDGRHLFYWITYEPFDTAIERFWCNITSDDGTQISEPSYTNASTGIEENRLVLWRQEMTLLWEREEVKLRWTFSDQNEDLPNLADSSTEVKGRIAYICEYDNYTINLYD